MSGLEVVRSSLARIKLRAHENISPELEETESQQRHRRTQHAISNYNKVICPTCSSYVVVKVVPARGCRGNGKDQETDTELVDY
jgi:DNA-directed RNA polymerase subunit RPC12/RpoP